MQRQCSRTNEQLTSNGPVLNRGEVYEPHGEEEFRGGGLLENEALSARKVKARGAASRMLVALLAVVFAAVVGLGTAQAASANPLEAVGEFFTSLLSGEPEEQKLTGDQKVADKSSIADWEGFIDGVANTQNIGRIWTDKTVSKGNLELQNGKTVEIGNSDFLVTLSAISSASNATSTTSKPLDIVLVLDTSGSMDDEPHMGTRPEDERYKYTPIYDPQETQRAIYYTVDGKKITAEGKWEEGTGWIPIPTWKFTNWKHEDGQTVYPKTSETDEETGHIQFYERKDLGANITKLDAVKDAVSKFATETAKLNDSISDPNKQHRISLVTFESAPHLVSGLTPYTSSNVSGLISNVDDLRASGGTESDKAMKEAGDVLDSARTDAQKVVIFFTDGQPTSGTNWENKVAAGAINNAKNLKDNNTLIYSIGVFRDANVNDEDFSAGNFNGYMHAVSSNYPEATAKYGSNNRYQVTPGKRAEDSHYYKTASTADELNDIFTDIQQEIVQKATFPTDVTEGDTPDENGTRSGYITFKDQLGDYMQVDSLKKLVSANQEINFEGNLEDVATGEWVTGVYNHENVGNPVYPQGNASQIQFKITRGTDDKTGDTIEVRAPAALIPLRYYQVDNKDPNNPTMTVNDAMPIRISYGVSIKPGIVEDTTDKDGNTVLAKIKNPDNALKQYIADQKNTDGTVKFYSNKYSGNSSLQGTTEAEDQTIGDTTATFTPASTNSFYYFTQDTPLYVKNADGDMEPLRYDPNAGLDENTTYYYNRPYWEQKTDGGAKYVEENYVEITKTSGLDYDHIKNDGKGNACIKAGTQHLSRIYGLNREKTPDANQTGTANTVLNPDWDKKGAEAHNIIAALGNNGRASVAVPGTLKITKDMVIPDGYDASKHENDTFTMQVAIADMKNQEVDAEIQDAQGKVVENGSIKLLFDDNGVATHSIKEDQSLVIYGLKSGVAYTVTEKDLPTYFTSSITNNGTGTIKAAAVESVTVTNTYKATPVTVEGKNNFNGVKVLSGRDWLDADEFVFVMGATNENGKKVLSNDVTAEADAPEGTASATEVKFNFGDLTFNAEGEYTFQIYEDSNASTRVGIVTFSEALYKVTVNVVDNGDGTLTPTVTKTRVTNDKVDDTTGVGNPVDVAKFTNKFDANSVGQSLTGWKVYTDNSGKKPNDGNMFKFLVTAESGADGYGPLPAGAQDNKLIVNAENGQRASISFGTATFDASMVGHTYSYLVQELVQNAQGEWKPVKEIITTPDSNNNYTLDGMTYDANEYRVSVSVGVNTDGSLKVDFTYPDAQKNYLEFNNSYTPTPYTLKDDELITGSKTLTGRNMLTGESFGFELSLANGPENGCRMPNNTYEEVTSTPGTFTFSAVTFTKPGTYVFNIKETKYGAEALPAESAEPYNGLKFDRGTATATVKIKDNGGSLALDGAIEYKNSKDQDAANAAFTNVYTTTDLNLSGKIVATKTLQGRNMTEDDKFTFTLSSDDKVLATVKNDAAKDGVASQLKGLFNSLKFTQKDMGNDFTYTVDELNPGKDENAPASQPGVTYTPETYTINIKIRDNGNGTMQAQTSITNAEGDKVWPTGDVSEADLATAMDTPTLSFVNTYKGNPTGNLSELLTGYKVLTGRDWAEGDEFTFTVTPKNGAPAPKNSSATLEASDVMAKNESTLKDSENKSFPFDFGELKFTDTGDYTYEVKETQKNANGVITDTKTITYVIGVSDNLSGKMVATLKSPTLQADKTFTNTYRASSAEDTAAQVSANKKLTGRDMAVGEFKFVIKTKPSGDDAGKPTVVAEGSNVKAADGVAGEVAFVGTDGAMTYDLKKLNDAVGAGYANEGTNKDGNRIWTLHYTAEEVTKNADGSSALPAGVTAGDTSFDFDVTVTDDGKGGLTSAVEVLDNKDIVFTNTYGQNQTATVRVAGTKTLSHEGYNNPPSIKNAYKFTLSGAPLHKAEGFKDVPTNDGEKGGNVVFGDLTYTMADLKDVPYENGKRSKTFTYTVTEDGEVDGVANDQGSHTFTVTLSDEGNGTLKATVDKDANKFFNFVNTFSASGTTEVDGKSPLAGTKTVTNGSVSKNQYTFQLEGADDETNDAITAGTIVLDASSSKVITTQNKADGSFAFGNITFTKASPAEGWNFTVSEVEPEASKDKVPGVTYDKSTYNVNVKVTETGTSTLNVETVITKDDAPVTSMDFTNEYGQGQSATANIAATKQLDGRDMADGEFSFEVKTKPLAAGAKPAQTVLTGTSAAADNGKASAIDFDSETTGRQDGTLGAYTFSSLKKAEQDGYATYDAKTKTWTVNYTIAEVGTLPGGVTAVADANSFDFTVTVKDNEDGTLTATLNAPETGFAFKNTYGTGDGTTVDTNTDAKFAKQLKGRDWKNTDSFSFTIEPQNGAPAPAATTATVDKSIKADKEGVKQFGFGSIKFTDEDMVGATKNADGKMEKTFTYTVKENDYQIAGVTPETKGQTATMTIKVTDDGKGNLIAATPTVTNGTFVNVYSSKVELPANALMNISKKLTGRDMTEGQFTFTVKPVDQITADKFGMAAEGVQVTDMPAAANGETASVAVATKAVTFTNEDKDQTYTFKVSENGTSGSGYTFDATNTGAAKVTIKLADNTEGVLTVTVAVAKGDYNKTVSYSAGADAQAVTVPFENTYEAQTTTLGGNGSVSINATKQLTNRPLQDKEFTFNVVNKLDKAQTVVATGTNDANGKITFTGIDYSTKKLEDDAGKLATRTIKDGVYTYEYQYTVSEVAPADSSGVTVTTPSFDITVTVTDAGKGEVLGIAVAYPQGSNGLTFVNQYGQDQAAPLNINGSKAIKTLSGDNAPTLKDIAGAYTFTLSGTADDGSAAPVPASTTAKNDGAGNVSFGTITYTMENVFGDTGDQVATVAEGEDGEADETAAPQTRSKTFTYTVTESGSFAGIANDPETHSFTVTVTDNGNGTLSVASDPAEGAQFAFTNTYSVTPTEPSSVTDSISIAKTLDGRDPKAGEFTFELLENGQAVPGVPAATNDASGKVTFAGISYSEPGAHTYTVREVDNGLGGVTYDKHAYTIVTTVTDNGNGTLSVAHKLQGEGAADNAIVFSNSYTAADTSITLGASKVLDGRDLADGEFKFQVTDGNGAVVATGTNDENGQVDFGTIKLTKAGTYTFTTSEVLPEDDDPDAKGVQKDDVTYDETVYTSKVVVKDNGSGQLEVSADESSIENAVFTNTYVKPEEPTPTPKPEPKPEGPELPSTGDSQLPGGVLAAVAAAGAALVGTGVVLEKRRH